VTQVEEVKCLIRIAPFFAAGVLFNAIIAQLTTVFIEQGATMDRRMAGGGFEMPPGSMQVFTALVAVVFAPIYDYVLVPMLRKRTGRAKGLTTLQRMGWGIALSIVAMVVAAVVEKKRLAAAESSPELIDVPFSTLPVSMYWLVPQYAILGIALVFAIVGQMDFFYSEVSDGMRSVGISLPLVCRGLGNYVSTLLVTIVVRITTSGGRLGWIPANLNRAHLDYFYWLLAALMAATLAFYVVAAHFYTYLHDDDDNECRKHKEVGLTNPQNKTPKP
jgi:peptide/histidine transporter 3/4